MGDFKVKFRRLNVVKKLVREGMESMLLFLVMRGFVVILAKLVLERR